MPRPRKLTEEQESAALAAYQSGVLINQLAKTYDLTWANMREALRRAEARGTPPVSVSRETGTEAQP